VDVLSCQHSPASSVPSRFVPDNSARELLEWDKGFPELHLAMLQKVQYGQIKHPALYV